MSIELKQAAQQALDAFDAFGDDDNFESLFALTQKMEALQAAIQQAEATQLAEVTDERQAFEACEVMAGSLFKRRADDPEKYWDGNVQDDWELWQASAILALRPVQAPMTDELCWQIWDKAGACDEVNERVTLKVAKPIIRAIVAAYLEVTAHRGITAQAKKETP